MSEEHKENMTAINAEVPSSCLASNSAGDVMRQSTIEASTLEALEQLFWRTWHYGRLIHWFKVEYGVDGLKNTWMELYNTLLPSRSVRGWYIYEIAISKGAIIDAINQLAMLLYQFVMQWKHWLCCFPRMEREVAVTIKDLENITKGHWRWHTRHRNVKYWISASAQRGWGCF